MKIKSLLLGSAAASMLAVSGAQAADPIIYAEPEPMEYVRVCDVYGAGFFYIPGTETCLAISGYVWYQIGATSDRGALSNDTPNYHDFADDRWNKRTRVRLNFDTRSETEWGTLRGYIRLQGTWEANGVANDGPVAIDQAFIELGGLRLGYTESAWNQTQTGGVSNWGSHTWGGLYYGYQQRQLISYSFAGGNGFHATLSLENDTVYGFGDSSSSYGRGYVPDVVGVVGINQAWGGAWLKAGFDERINEDQSAFGLQAGAQINVPNSPGSSLRVIGYFANGDTQYSSDSPLGTAARWSVLASYQHRFNPEFAASVGVQYFNSLYFPASKDRSDFNAWAAEAMLLWTPVTNFEVRGEYTYTKATDLDGSHSGFLRFTRYF